MAYSQPLAAIRIVVAFSLLRFSIGSIFPGACPSYHQHVRRNQLALIFARSEWVYVL